MWLGGKKKKKKHEIFFIFSFFTGPKKSRRGKNKSLCKQVFTSIFFGKNFII